MSNPTSPSSGAPPTKLYVLAAAVETARASARIAELALEAAIRLAPEMSPARLLLGDLVDPAVKLTDRLSLIGLRLGGGK